jgi:hypothetical protein
VSDGSFQPDPGTPPLQVRRILVRAALLVAIVWGSPLTIISMAQLWLVGYGAWMVPLFIAFAVLCHVAGRLVGRFEKDSPLQYAVGCSWPYWLVGAMGVPGGYMPAMVHLPGAGVLFIAGWTGAKRAVGRRTKLIAEGKCLFCEYDLAGLGAVGVCPECGQKFDRAAASGVANR